MIHLTVYLIGVLLIPSLSFLTAWHYNNDILNSRAIARIVIISILWPMLPMLVAVAYGAEL